MLFKRRNQNSYTQFTYPLRRMPYGHHCFTQGQAGNSESLGVFFLYFVYNVLMYRWSPKVKPSDVQEWVVLYQSGVRTKDIAPNYGVTWITVQRYLKEKGVLASRSKSKMGSRNPLWAGDTVKHQALHAWVRRHKLKPDICEHCFDKPLDLANKSGLYKRDLEDWEWLCRRCHMVMDGRMNNLKYVNDYYGCS